jgi:acetylornithine deacetylase
MNSQRLTELLTELIAIPSVNPAHSDDLSITGEQKMADGLGQLLEARGMQVEQHQLLGPGRPAIIARSPISAPHTLMFGVHLDTVGVDHMTVEPFTTTIRDGKIYGRGTCDMKGSTAALLYALTPERIESLAHRGVQLLIIGTPDEECGMGGARELSKGDLHADAAIILEPTQCAPVIAHKSAHWIEIELIGRSGHGSQPESGVSTNAALASFLPDLFDLHQNLTRIHSHPLLGHSTLNIGKIVGGSTFNIIPEKTILQLDRRVIPNEPLTVFDQAVEELIQRYVTEGKLLSGSVTVKAHTRSFATEPDRPLVLALQQAALHITGHSPEPYGTSWVSDAAPFSQIADDILVFGPGDIAQAHTADEFITLEQLETGARIFEHVLDTYASPAFA